MRFLFVFLLLALTSGAIAQANDHNLGLLLKGHVYSWRIVKIKSGMPQSSDFVLGYLMSVDMEFTNNSDRRIIVPRRIDCWDDLKFLEIGATGAVETEVVHSFERGHRCELSNLKEDEPRSDIYRVIDPGESSRFPQEFCFRDEKQDRFFFPGSLRDIFVSSERLQTILNSTHMQFSYKAIGGKRNDADLLDKAAARWKRFGILPLNDNDEFSIVSQRFASNTEWIRREE